jgi:PAS domain S-box-containing protein
MKIEAAHRRRLLGVLLPLVGGSALLALLTMLATILLGVAEPSADNIAFCWNMAAAALVLAGLHVVNRHVSTDAASVAFVSALLILVLLTDDPMQVVEGRSLMGVAVVIVAASVLIRPWASLVAAVISYLALGALALAAGLPWPHWVRILTFLLLALLTWYPTHHLGRALAELAAVNAAQRARFDRRERQQQAIIKLADSETFVSGDLAAGLRDLTETAAEAMGVARVGVWLLSEDGQELRCADLYDAAASRHEIYPPLKTESAPRYFAALRNERAIAAHDAAGDPRTAEFQETYFASLGIASTLDAAICVAGRCTGVICHEHIGPARHWTEDEISFAGELADQVAHLLLDAERDRVETERSAALGKLAQERHLLRTLIDILPDSIYAKDTEARFILNNAAQLRILGARDQQEALGKSDFDYHPAELASRYFEDDQRVVQSGQPLLTREEPVVDHGTGKVLWKLTTKAPLRDDQGQVIGLVGIGRDITARKQMEAEREALLGQLRSSEARYRELVESLGEGIATVDAEERFLFANPAADAIFGVQGGGLIGRSLREFTHPESLALLAEQTARRLRGEGSRYTLDIIRPDNQRRTLAVTARPQLDREGVFVSTLGVFHDITERIRAQEAEREQRLFAESLRDAAAAIASTLSFDEVLDRILAEVGEVVPHDAARIMLVQEGVAHGARGRGYGERPPAEPISTLHLPIASTANLRTMIETGRPLVIADTHLYDGWVVHPQQPWIRSTAGAPIRAKDQIIGFLCLDSATPGFYTPAHAERLQAFADQAAVAIENARLYQAARDHAAALEETVARRTTELQQANERLKEQDRLKGEFMRQASHELRTPLTNVKTSAWLLEHGKPEKRDYYLATLQRDADVLHGLIEDLITTMTLDLGRVRPMLQPMDVGQIADRAAKSRAQLLADRGLNLHTIVAPDLPPALADPRLLTQALANLIADAADRSPQGAQIVVECRLQTEPEPAADWVTISVREALETPASLAGAGLRLAICEELARQHRGKLTVERQPGQGRVTALWLPRG